MQSGQALALAALLLIGGATGCGAMFNGLTKTVSVRSTTPGAEIYLNGGLAGKSPQQLVTSNSMDQVITIRAAGYADQDIELKRSVRPLPIALDLLWCLTIVGVAAPISDALLGTFSSLEPGEVEVTLAAAPPRGPTPLQQLNYASGDRVATPVTGATISSAAQPAANDAAASTARKAAPAARRTKR